MPIEIENQQSTTTQGREPDITSLSPEMVKIITDLVYGFLMEELRIEKERTQFSSQSEKSGGW